MAEYTRGRMVRPLLMFNGQAVTEVLKPYLERVSITDVASGSSDSIEIDLYDVDMQWLTTWYPTKGDSIGGAIRFEDWGAPGDVGILDKGTYTLDAIEFSGNPLSCRFSGLAIPSDRAFKTKERTQTWEMVSLAQIAGDIASRYGLALMYSAPDYTIECLEQTAKTDSDFLYSTVKDYGLKMKVYNESIVVFDPGVMESQTPVATIKRDDFIADGWTYKDELEGTYTGITFSYKDPDGGEYTVELGDCGNDARVMSLNASCSDYAEAEVKAKAKVNEANEKLTTISGTIWGGPAICSGQTVLVDGLGKADGKYYIDKLVTTVGQSGTVQRVDMHKCYTRL